MKIINKIIMIVKKCMNKKIILKYIFSVTIAICGLCSCEHVPTLPLIVYDKKVANLNIIQADTAAHDSVYIHISNIYSKAFPINDTLTFSIPKIIKKLDQIELAYTLATQNNTLPIKVWTSRTNDTVFNYIYRKINIPSIPIAKVISGDCIGFYDVNYKRNYKNKIRAWIFRNNILPDSVLIEDMNSLMKQFNYSGYNEYSKFSGDIPIVKSLRDKKFRINTNVEGDYFYLCACQSEQAIKSFVEEKISNGLKDAKHSIDEEFTCSHKGKSGTNTIFLIAIDDNWKYTILPIGLVAIDNIAPKIIPKGHKTNRSVNSNRALLAERQSLRASFYNYRKIYMGSSSHSNVNRLFINHQNILVNMPTISSIISFVTISYGNFSWDYYGGYNIPFYIDIYGDVKAITIGNHLLDSRQIKKDECVRLNIKQLHMGDNSLPLSAIDSRGNKSTSSLHISIVPIRNRNNNNDYDDLENRISNLESRMDDLE